MEFIKKAVSCIKEAPYQEMKFQLLHNNTKLIDNQEVINALFEFIQQPDKQRKIFNLLEQVGQWKLPSKIVLVLVKMAGDPSFKGDAQTNAIRSLGRIARIGQASPKYLWLLVKLATEPSFLDEEVRDNLIKGLIQIVESGQVLPLEALKFLVQVVADPSINESVRLPLVILLKKIDLLNLALLPNSLLEKICYLTRRALVISEDQVSISGSNRRIVKKKVIF